MKNSEFILTQVNVHGELHLNAQETMALVETLKLYEAASDEMTKMAEEFQSALAPIVKAIQGAS